MPRNLFAMVNRPAGGPRSQKYERSDHDFYIEPPRSVEQLLHSFDFGNDLIWDPCCGTGNILDISKIWGHPTFGSDIVDRHARHRFKRGNILTHISKIPKEDGRETSVICNPPYGGDDKDLAEKIILRILETFPVRRAAFILPIAFQAGQKRWSRDRLGRYPKSHVGTYMERHTMPPGHMKDMASTTGGMADYCVMVWTRPHRFRTEFVHIEPGHQVPRHSGAGSQGVSHVR